MGSMNIFDGDDFFSCTWAKSLGSSNTIPSENNRPNPYIIFILDSYGFEEVSSESSFDRASSDEFYCASPGGTSPTFSNESDWGTI